MKLFLILVILFSSIGARVILAQANEQSVLEIQTFYAYSYKALETLNKSDVNAKTKAEKEALFDEIKAFKGWYNYRLHWIHTPIIPYQDQISYSVLAENVARRFSDLDNVAWALLIRGKILFKNQTYEEAVKSTIAAYNIYSSTENVLGLSQVYFAFAELYETARLYRKAIHYFELSNKMLDGKTAYAKERMFINQNHIGQCYSASNRFTEALNAFNYSLQKLDQQIPESHAKDARSYVYAQISKVYLNSQRTVEAEVYLDSAHVYSPENQTLNATYLHLRSKIKLTENMLQEAKKLAALSIGQLKRQNRLAHLPEVFKTSSDIYRALGNNDSAYILLKEYSEINDAIYREATSIKSLLLIPENELKNQNDCNSKLTSRNRIYLVVSVFTFCMSVMLYFFYRKMRRVNLKLVEQVMIPLHPKEIVFNNDGLPSIDRDVVVLAKSFQNLIEKDNLFLDSRLTLPEIARLLNTNTSYLSKAINSYYKMNVNSYINKYKIDYAVQLIKVGKAENLTVEAIAKESGFNNRVVFSSTFKKVTGITPSFFIKNHHKSSVDIDNEKDCY